MTYLHALQYLSEYTPGTSVVQSTALAAAYRSAVGVGETRFYTLLFSADRRSLLCAAYCRAALLAAGIRVGEIADSSCGALSDTLRIDGAPASPTLLRELCHAARAAEQKLLRPQPSARAAVEESDTPTANHPRPCLDLSLRCGAVLPRLFAETGCRVVLLIGKGSDPRLSALTQSAPAHTVAILGGSENGPLPAFPIGTAEVISPTCGNARFRRVTDACARTGSRLTLTATTHLQRGEHSPFSQRFSYRSVQDGILHCGNHEALRQALLACEALLTLRRFGISLPDACIRQGLATVSLPTFFAPLSLRPPFLAHAIHDPDDVKVLLQSLEEFSTVLPRPIRFVYDATTAPALLAPLRDAGEVMMLEGDTDLPAPSAEAESVGSCILVGPHDALCRQIEHWQRTVRRL